MMPYQKNIRMNVIVYLHLFFCALVAIGVDSTTFSLHNNCPFNVYPATLTSRGTCSSTGLELAPQANFDLSVSQDWSGRIWARFSCSDSGGSFHCNVGDCGTGQVACNGLGGAPPASLVEFTLSGSDGQDFYDISLVDGFNLPIQVTGNCGAVSCSVDINNHGCPPELAVYDNGGGIIGCKSACLAFNQPQYCCSGDYASPDKCQPSQYSMIFKQLCPQAYSYAFDDKSSTFTCNTGSNYAITFCP